jgi:deazaflavin-dependent oxidoreductase (nitroreductase family)
LGAEVKLAGGAILAGMALDPVLAAEDMCYLETVGRRSGQPREIEIWFAADPERDRIYILSGGRDQAQWVRNLRVQPAVRVQIRGSLFRGTASEIEGTDAEIPARRLVGAKYGYWKAGTPLSGWARDSLPVAIDLVPSAR